MPQVDLVDETFVVADPEIVAEVVRDSRRWRRWWPDLRLTVFEDRGREGVRWNVTGALVGSMEVWLQAHGDGVIAHYYLRADPTVPGRPTVPRTLSRRAIGRELRLRRRRARQIFWAIKDGLEGARAVGESREPDVERDPANPRRTTVSLGLGQGTGSGANRLAGQAPNGQVGKPDGAAMAGTRRSRRAKAPAASAGAAASAPAGSAGESGIGSGLESGAAGDSGG